MVQTADLITLQQVVDDETGIWFVGEVDYSIHLDTFETFLDNYGVKGADRLIDTLLHLALYVKEKMVKRQEEQATAEGYGIAKSSRAT